MTTPKGNHLGDRTEVYFYLDSLRSSVTGDSDILLCLGQGKGGAKHPGSVSVVCSRLVPIALPYRRNDTDLGQKNQSAPT
jgi:hypothetical protein